jgi:hypothetical protein
LTSRSDVRPNERTLRRSALGLLHQLGDGVDAGRLEAVARPDREVQVVDRHVELADQLLVDAGGGGGVLADALVPSSKYCTNGLRCLRKILAASTSAMSGVVVPLVQISRVSLS